MVEHENILTYFLNAIKTELHDDNSSYNIANRLSQNIVQTMQLVRRKNYDTDGFMVWGMSVFVRDNAKDRIEALHYYLELLREKKTYDTGSALHNIIRTMRIARHNIICNEDLSFLDFGNIPFNGIYWSNDTFESSSLNAWNFMSGHRDKIILVKESVDENFILSCGVDGEVVVWEKESCLVHKFIATVDTRIIDASFLTESSLLCVIVLLASGNVLKWNVSSGELVATYKVIEDGAITGAISDNGKICFCISHENKYTVINTDDNNIFESSIDIASGIKPVSAKIIDTQAILGLDNSEVAVIDLKKDSVRHYHTEHNGAIISTTAFISKNLLFCSTGSIVYLINILDGTTKGKLIRHKGAVNSIALSEHYYLTGSDDKTAIVWDSSTLSPISVLKGHTKEISCVFICKDGKHCFTASNDQSIRFWDMRLGRCLKIIEGFSSPISAIDFDLRFDRLLLSTWNSNTVCLWDLKSNKKLGVGYNCPDFSEACAISPNGSFLLSGVWDGSVITCFIVNPTSIHSYREHNDIISSVKTSKDGTLFVTGSWDKTVRVWNIKEQRCVSVITGHKGIVTDVNISDDNTYILTASADKTAMIYNNCNNAKTILVGHKNAVTSIAASHNNDMCITGSEDATAIIWSFSTGKMLRTLDGHQSTISYVDFISNSICVTCSWDNTARLWDATNGTHICTYTIPDKNVSQIIWKFPYCIVNRGGVYEVWKADIFSYIGKIEKCNTIYSIDKLFIANCNFKSVKCNDITKAILYQYGAIL